MLQKALFRPHSWPSEQISSHSKRLLDLGCGNGTKLFEFTKRGYEVWGVDVSGDAIEVCCKFLPGGHFIVSELEKIDLPDNYFDYIRIDNALEHVPEPHKTIEECYRLLKKDGSLLIYVPNGRSFSLRFMKGDSISSWIPFHLQLFTKESLYRICIQAGFKNINIYGYYPASWFPLSIMQWKIRRNNRRTLMVPSKWLISFCYPAGWIFSKFGFAEELVGVMCKDGIN